jgi:hypothetical protein
VRNHLSVGFALLGVACGSAAQPAPPPKAPDPPPAEAEEAKKADPPPEKEAPVAAEAPAKIPTECVTKDGVCTVGKDFAKRVCQSTYVNVALAMFAKGTPWQRGYLTRKTQAWNAEGGASVAGFVEFDEEVLVLFSRVPPKGGMTVSGMGGFQTLRFDGSCVTLQTEEVTFKRPPAPKYPRIEWRWLEDGMRDALRKDSKVDAAYLAQRKECKGVTTGDVSKKCVTADQKLVDSIVEHVVSGGEMASPTKLP